MKLQFNYMFSLFKGLTPLNEREIQWEESSNIHLFILLLKIDRLHYSM